MSTAKPKKKSATRWNQRKIRNIDLTEEICDLQHETALHSTLETPPCTKDGQTLARDEQPLTQKRNEPKRGNPTTSQGRELGEREQCNVSSTVYSISQTSTPEFLQVLQMVCKAAATHGKVDQRSAQSRGMRDSAGTWHVQRAQASRVGKATENCKNSLFRAQGENKHINTKDMSSTRPCVVILIVNVLEEVSTKFTKPITINIAMRGSGFKGVDVVESGEETCTINQEKRVSRMQNEKRDYLYDEREQRKANGNLDVVK
ncbi:hypothetical protein BJY52DRAFT_1228309 [Lactarius psammicola]|nr:hypothetical protein BJY52DRAFT_1228309 [Lactarius psammicola]